MISSRFSKRSFLYLAFFLPCFTIGAVIAIDHIYNQSPPITLLHVIGDISCEEFIDESGQSHTTILEATIMSEREQRKTIDIFYLT